MTTGNLADGTLTDGGPQADEAFVFTDDMYEGGAGAPGLPGYNEMGKAPLGEGELTYRGMNILAPMVRVHGHRGVPSLPLLHLIPPATPAPPSRPPAAVNSVDFVEPSTGIVVFRTCEAERTRVAFQIGTADAVRALRAAEMVSVPPL
ncbi:unnamed protein product [Closterium sp. NIES-54]